jgi:hypothetical protein
MDKFFEEKLIVIGNDAGQRLEIFMRPIKIKEFKLINRISKLAQGNNSDEFIDPILLELVSSSLSIDTEKIPAAAVQGLVGKYLEYNFPESKEEKSNEAKIKKAKKKTKRLAFYIDFLVNQGHNVPDIMELTIIQFNDLIQAAAERISPEKEVMDPEDAFRKMGIPIRDRKK